MTSAGVCSTSMSGGTPSFSTTQPSSGVQIARFGRGDAAAVHQHRETEDADEAAPRALADERAHLVLAEHPRQEIAARAGGLVDDHRLRPLNRRERRLEVGAVAHRPVGDERPAQDVDVVVGDAAAAVEPLVDDDRVLVDLRIEVALEVACARSRRCSARRRRRRGRRSPCRPSSGSLRPSRGSAAPPSLAIGTTCTVRDPDPSAFGPSVISTILPAVFSNRL